MALSIWEVFLALFRGGEDDETSAQEGGHRFVPSPLDLSVREGHGGTDGDRVRELTRISERARDIEASRRDP